METQINKILLYILTISICATSATVAGMTSTNYQVKDTAIIVGGEKMTSDNFIGRLVVDQSSPFHEVMICNGNSDPDSDIDGKDLAVFAASVFTQDELAKFAGIFGETNCDKGE